jgi:hypothetical protein
MGEDRVLPAAPIAYPKNGQYLDFAVIYSMGTSCFLKTALLGQSYMQNILIFGHHRILI